MSEPQRLIVTVNGRTLLDTGWCDLNVEIESNTEVLENYQGRKRKTRTRHGINVTASGMEPERVDRLTQEQERLLRDNPRLRGGVMIVDPVRDGINQIRRNNERIEEQKAKKVITKAAKPKLPSGIPELDLD